MLHQYDTPQVMSEMGDPSLRMLYITVVIVALFITCGFISAIHEHGFHGIRYPLNVWNNDLTNYTDLQRRELRNSVYKRKSGEPKHYRLPKDSVLDSLSNLTLSKVFWFYTNNIQTICRNMTSMSSEGEGMRICVDDLNMSKRPSCLVYSVGYDVSFDFELQVKRTYNCEVHVLQGPRFQNKIYSQQKLFAANHSVNLPDGMTVHEMVDTNINKLSLSIRKAINRANKVIDVLKMELDGNEWSVLQTLLNSGLLIYVRQLLVEIHFGWGGVSKCEDLKILRQLYEAGFRISINKHKLTSESISYMPNLTITNVNEILMINSRQRGRLRF